MKLNSSDIEEGSRMAKMFEVSAEFGGNGENLSPALAWRDAPEATRSFAITVYDPDAPAISGFWHWVVLDIPATVTDIARGASRNQMPGRELRNDYGGTGFGGACPPAGDGMHRYQFTIWALPTEKIALPEDASKAFIGFTLNNTAIAKATLTTTYVIE